MVCEKHFLPSPLIASPLARALFSLFMLLTSIGQAVRIDFFIAFILYRQHYQAQVVAQNPGLANPEISKIIGEQWRDQPVEVKNEWKRLAEVLLYFSKV